jgi:hypothetical protein
MKSKSLIALTILCLALGACATTDTVKDPNIASAEDHANQGSIAAKADDVSYSTLTPKTEVTTVTTNTTEPVWNSTVQNPPATDATLTQSGSSTTVNGTSTDNTASISTSTSTTTTTATTSTPDSMTSSSTVDDDDTTDDTTTATETRTRLRKD